MSTRCETCGGRHTTCKCPWAGCGFEEWRRKQEHAREVGRFLLALVVIAVVLGVFGSMDCADAQLLAQP